MLFDGVCLTCVVTALRGKFRGDLVDLATTLGIKGGVRDLADVAMDADLLQSDSVKVLAKYLDNAYTSYSHYETISERGTAIDECVVTCAKWHVLCSAIFLSHKKCLLSAIKGGWHAVHYPGNAAMMKLANIFTGEKMFDDMPVDDIVKAFCTIVAVINVKK